MLDYLITSKTRLKLLIKFFSNPKNQGHLRGLAEEFGESTNAIRKELNNLSEAGLLLKEADSNKIEYKANIDHPLFHNLQELINKYLGLDKLLSTVLERMGDVNEVALVGDYAKGLNTGKLQVLITGDDLNEDYLDRLSERIEDLIQKEVEFQIQNSITDPKAFLLYKK
ncbi:winged helix-turn-helix domain-containing protein [Shivajiella indica]|uniref:Winged helix-turn-helix domain-containing protein n=1 Tax=Shivajiella indica TaxID=872115 RepID=A0ABW5BBU5_9BACT